MQNQELSVGYNRFAFGCNRTTRHPGRDAEQAVGQQVWSVEKEVLARDIIRMFQFMDGI